MLSQSWRTRLRWPHSRKVILCTIWLQGAPGRPLAHPALSVNSLHYATEPAEVTASGGRTVLFEPWILTWPTGLTYRVSLEDHRAETPQATLTIGSGARLPETLLAAMTGRTQQARARLDLWTDGIALDDAILLLEGAVTQPQRTDDGGGLQFTVVEGPAQPGTVYPPGLLSRTAFPDAPDGVADVVSRQEVWGPIPDHMPAYAIDGGNQAATTRRYYLCDGPATPQAFYKGGGLLPEKPIVERATDGTGQTFTRLTFASPIASYRVGIDDSVTVSGGSGRLSRGVLLDLAELAGYDLTPQARTLFGSQAFTGINDLSVLVSSPTDVASLIFDRLLPQTTLLPTWRGGKLHAWDVAGVAPHLELGLNTGLRGYLAGPIQETAENRVFNEFTIGCGRNLDASTANTLAPLLTLYRNPATPGAAGALCRLSQMQFGRRVYGGDVTGSKPGIDAADLIVVRDAQNVPKSCPAGERLADSLAAIHCLPHRQYMYDCEWEEGMYLRGLLWRALLTDETQQLEATPTRVVAWELLSAGPRVTFQTEDARVA